MNVKGSFMLAPPVASSPSQSPADPVISTQFAVRTPAVLSSPLPSKSVKD